jgi:hypothetical protein
LTLGGDMIMLGLMNDKQIGNFEGVCADAGCAIATNARLITSGTISSVPEPSTTLAVGFGSLLVLGVGMLRRSVH